MPSHRTLLAAVVLCLFVDALGTQQAQARFTAETVRTPLADATGCPGGCGQPCITYRHRGPKLCCDCKPPTDLVLKVKNPCACCEVDVPICLPACCTGEPTVCCGVGFLGRDVVEYQWCCGFSVRIAFKRCGDLLVTTWGR